MTELRRCISHTAYQTTRQASSLTWQGDWVEYWLLLAPGSRSPYEVNGIYCHDHWGNGLPSVVDSTRLMGVSWDQRSPRLGIRRPAFAV